MKQTICITVLLLTLACTQAAEENPRFVELKNLNSARSPIAFSPDAKKIASIEYATIRFWDTATGDELPALTVGATHQNLLVVFSPDGKKIAAAGHDEIARIWEIESGKMLQEFKGEHTAPIECVAFSPDGKKLVTASWDLTGRIWDVESGKMQKMLLGHTGFIKSVAFSPDGKRIATTSSPGGEGKTVHYEDERGAVSYKSAKDGTIRIWDADSGMEVQRVTWLKDDGNSFITPVLFPDWKKYISVVRTLKVVGRGVEWEFYAGVFDFESGKELYKLDGMGMPGSDAVFAISNDGKRVLVANFDKEFGNTRIHDAESGNLLHSWGGKEGKVSYIAYSSDRNRFITTAFDGTRRSARIWNLEALLPRSDRPAVSDF